ncbi:MAG: A/G-specific adenine glycosylase [Candidatus Dormibacteria bacterium]|jgi:A/G-specific adenine glycosylase
MWTDSLPDWFAEHGRHHLPWRLTTDPWSILVSEVMLQQTSVGRVLPRWSRFLCRWPDADHCAAATLADVLREWQGMGYPRRARALWLAAARVAAEGWPTDEASLRTLPGVGAYTARALLAFSDVGVAVASPRDVNVGRVAARAALGREPAQARVTALDTVLSDSRPHGMPLRDYTYALFDVGTLHCRSQPRCEGCPLAPSCAFRGRGVTAQPGRRTPYEGSLRQLRGAILAAVLDNPTLTCASLREAVSGVAGATPQRFDEAVAGLAMDGLLPSDVGVC